jgi:hypothetical protein
MYHGNVSKTNNVVAHEKMYALPVVYGSMNMNYSVIKTVRNKYLSDN